MSTELAVLLVLLGLVAAFLSGLLGIGGALMLIPMLIYLPEAFGLAEFDIRAASAIAVTQVAVASASGSFSNLRRGLVYHRLAAVIVGALVAGAFFSGWASQFLPSTALLVVLAALATLAAASMLLPPALHELGPAKPRFNPFAALSCGLFVGTVIGLVGGGSFMLLPLQVFALRVPTRTAMATGLAAVTPAALAAVFGKLLGGQVPLLPAVLVTLAAVPGAQLGATLSARLSARLLRRIYAVVVLSVATGLWYDVFRQA